MEVYFIAKESVVKVGHSRSPTSRLRSARAFADAPLKLIGSTPGGRAQEKIAHKMLERHKKYGEWFHLNEDSKKIIKNILEKGLL